MRPNNRHTILGIWFGVVIMALSACGSDTGPAQNQEAEVTVQEIVNRVEVNTLRPETNELTFVDLQLGQYLRTGNLVKTHENSTARVDISIQGFSRVSRTSPKTIWQLGRFALDGEAVIELQEGKIFIFDDDDGDEHWPLQIETPAGTASARGTWMAVGFDAESGTIQVQCLRGVCELENDFGYQVFTNEHAVAATEFTAPTVPVPMEQSDIDAFHDLPEVLSQELVIPAPFTAAEAKIRLEQAKAEAGVPERLYTCTNTAEGFAQCTNLAQVPEDALIGSTYEIVIETLIGFDMVVESFVCGPILPSRASDCDFQAKGLIFEGGEATWVYELGSGNQTTVTTLTKCYSRVSDGVAC